MEFHPHPNPPPREGGNNRKALPASGSVFQSAILEAIFPRPELRVWFPVTPENSNMLSSFDMELDATARFLREGGVAAIPTDTLYGLAADVFNSDAIERVFAIKERPEGMALPVLLADMEQLSQVAQDTPEAARALAEAYWPGPLTLIVRKAEGLPPRLTAGNATVAVRVPAHPVPRELARRLGRPITGTSANISGAPDPQSLDELRRQIGERVDCVVSAGQVPAGTASTIVDLMGDMPKLIREGAIPFSEIAGILGRD